MNERSLEGQKLGKDFVIGQELDKGGFSRVHLVHSSSAMQESLVAKLAVRPQDMTLEAQREMFERERAIHGLFQKSHNIVPLRDSGIQMIGETEYPYLVMDRADRSLKKAKDEANMSVEESMGAFRGITSALYDIHEAGFAHRDVKSANILKKGDTFWLTDFGISAPIGEETTPSATIRYAHQRTLESISNETALVVGSDEDIFPFARMGFGWLVGDDPYAPTEEMYDNAMNPAIVYAIAQANADPITVLENRIKHGFFPDQEMRDVRAAIGKNLVAFMQDTPQEIGEVMDALEMTYADGVAKQEKHITYHEGVSIPSVVEEEAFENSPSAQSAPDELVVFSQKRRVTRARLALAAAAAGVMLGLAAVKGGIFTNGERALVEAKPGTITQEELRKDDPKPGATPTEAASPTLPAKKMTPVEIPSIVPHPGQDEVIVYTGDSSPRITESTSPSPSQNETVDPEQTTDEVKPTPSKPEASSAETPIPDESETPAPSPSPTEDPTATPLPTDPAETPAPSVSPEQSGSPLLLAGSQ